MNLLVASDAGAQEYRVKGGTQQISKNLFKDIGEENVLFKHPVLTIDQVIFIILFLLIVMFPLASMTPHLSSSYHF
jgi:hypothetical protein